MLPPTPHYERHRQFIQQGDIGFFPFAQLLRPDEGDWLPGADQPPTVKAIPVFENMTEATVTVDGSSYLMRKWHGLGLVVDVTSELMNSPRDSRVTVAPLVPRAAVNLNWEQVVRGQIAGVLPLPQAERGSIDTEFPESDWPDVLLAARSLTTISRGIVESGRLMALTPRMTILLVTKLAEMFGARHWARMKHFANVEGQVLAQVDDIGKAQPPPTDGKWAVLTFGNGERIQVFVSPQS